MRPVWPRRPGKPSVPSSNLSAPDEREVRILISGLARVSQGGLSGSAYAFRSSAGAPMCEVTLRSPSGDRFLIHLPVRSSGFLAGAAVGVLAAVIAVATLAVATVTLAMAAFALCGAHRG